VRTVFRSPPCCGLLRRYVFEFGIWWRIYRNVGTQLMLVVILEQ
jgi:hypothetical protein